MFQQTAYHGTTKNKAYSIIISGSFQLSKRKNEWLGFGTYFFENYEEALTWAEKVSLKDATGENAAVISARLQSEDNLFCDLDKDYNMEKVEAEVREVLSRKLSNGAPRMRREEVRCLACNYYGMKHKIKIFAYTFEAFSYNSICFPKSREQRQFCVREHGAISNVTEEGGK